MQNFKPRNGAFAAVCSLRKSETEADVPVTYVAEPYGEGTASRVDCEDDSSSVASMASTVTPVSLSQDVASASLSDRTFRWTWSISSNGFDPAQNLATSTWLWERRREQVQKYPDDKGEMMSKLCGQFGLRNTELIEQILEAEAADVSDLLRNLPMRVDAADVDDVTAQMQRVDVGGSRAAGGMMRGGGGWAARGGRQDGGRWGVSDRSDDRVRPGGGSAWGGGRPISGDRYATIIMRL